jgi:carboxyl-terminal processing protease
MGRLVLNAKAASPVIAALSEDQIDKALFDGITGALDRFSRYAAPETARDQRAVRDGFGGIGITLELAGEEFRITQVTSRGPADLAGIRPDDRLVAVNGVATGGRSQSDVVHALRGLIFSPVEITVYRRTPAKDVVSSSAGPGLLPTVTCLATPVLSFSVATNQNTTQQIVEDLGRLQRERSATARHRPSGGPGGRQAVSLSDVFISKGRSSRPRPPSCGRQFTRHRATATPQIPIVVLINGVLRRLRNRRRGSSGCRACMWSVAPLMEKGPSKLFCACLTTAS